MITSYTVKYDRVDPKTAEPLTPGTEKTAYSDKNELVIKDLAAGGTYRIQVAVDTKVGTSVYSAGTISSTEMGEMELDKFRDSLNLGSMEGNIRALSSRPR